ncbi:MAG TPA: prolipoprotein diacylglyceryl transferase [bacterium]|nr:prolipoprotein diacylglyceryl transferase [bacterium]
MFFELGPLTVRWYGVMMGLALFLSIPITAHFAARFGIDRAVVDTLAVPFLATLVVGARAGYVVTHLGEFAGRPLAAVLPPYAGLASHGSIAAGLVFLAWWCPRHRVPVWRLLDAMAPAVLVAVVLVRWGNFMNGELFGAPTSLPWGVAVPGVPGGPRHPLPLYEIAGTLVILGGALAVARRRPFDGAAWWFAIAASSVLRFLLDLLRPEDRTPLFLTLGQIAALVLLGWALRFLWAGRHRACSPSGAKRIMSASRPHHEVRR